MSANTKLSFFFFSLVNLHIVSKWLPEQHLKSNQSKKMFMRWLRKIINDVVEASKRKSQACLQIILGMASDADE